MTFVPSFLARLSAVAVVLLAAVRQQENQVAGFGVVVSNRHSRVVATTSLSPSSLFAGRPKYEKSKGFLQESKALGKGNYLLTIDYDYGGGDGGGDGDGDDENTQTNTGFPRYEPGHVLGLEIQPPETAISSENNAATDDNGISKRMTTPTEKTQKDLGSNDGWLMGPYTVGFGYGTEQPGNPRRSDGFKVLIKEVGYKSHVLATAEKGTPVQFGGKFHVPIAEGILASANVVLGDQTDTVPRRDTKKVVMVSTGVGVSPCVGAVEELLSSSPSESSSGSTIRTIDLLASFRTTKEIYMDPVLEKLTASDDDKNKNNDDCIFRYAPIITNEKGRLSARGQEWLSAMLCSDNTASLSSLLSNTHYHIIGNRQLVNEWKEDLAEAGVPSKRITVEAYFNHSSKPDPFTIETICGAVVKAATAAAAATVTKEAAAAKTSENPSILIAGVEEGVTEEGTLQDI